ncbi:MAG: pyrroline-5-carboxylate reductase [Novosphingobium sp.]|jgi:pyrroline-5-carboxylate reductase|nr:pyrroline-5-carboxylate reductase [Novosphingobium sp.]
MDSLLLIGCGNMGGAMLAGWLRAGLAPARFTVVDPVLAEAPDGVALLRDLPADGSFDAILLGVKPQLLGEVAPVAAALAGPGTVVLSILAGVELATLARRFPDAGGVVRIMPNLAAAIGKSPIALAALALDERRKADVVALMEPLGTPEWLAAEAQFDLVTALAGSGPAFVYRFIDALAAGAAVLGLDAAQAQRLALAMVEGASLLAAASPHSPGELADRVASPGGTTRAGLDVLDDGAALARLVEATLRAARDRGAEMAREARN